MIHATVRALEATRRRVIGGAALLKGDLLKGDLLKVACGLKDPQALLDALYDDVTAIRFIEQKTFHYDRYPTCQHCRVLLDEAWENPVE